MAVTVAVETHTHTPEQEHLHTHQSRNTYTHTMSDTQYTPTTPPPHPSLCYATPQNKMVAKRNPPSVRQRRCVRNEMERRRLVLEMAQCDEDDERPLPVTMTTKRNWSSTNAGTPRNWSLVKTDTPRKRLCLGRREVDAMPAEEMFELIGDAARKEGVCLVRAGHDLDGAVDELDEDRVEDTYNDEEVDSEWFERRCANCGMDREGDDEYDSEDEDRPRRELVLWCCQYCEGDERD